MVLVCLAVFCACMIWAAVNDLLTMKVPNLCVATLLVAFAVAAPLSGMSWAVLSDHAVTMLGVLVICFCLFMFNGLGAGDGKLIAATALWLGPTSTLAFVGTFAVFGGIFALILLVFRGRPLPVRLASHPVIGRLSSGGRDIPYAVAIGPAGLLAIHESRWAEWLSPLY